MAKLSEILDPVEAMKAIIACDGEMAERRDAWLIENGFVDASGKPDLAAMYFACPVCKQDAWALCRCHPLGRDREVT